MSNKNIMLNAEIESHVYMFSGGSKVPVTGADKVIRSESGTIHVVNGKSAPELDHFLERITNNFTLVPSNERYDFWLTYAHKKHKDISVHLNQDGDIKLWIDQQEVLYYTNFGITYNPKLLNEAILKINDVS